MSEMNTAMPSAARLIKVAPVRIFEQAVGQIRELIMTGAWAEGERLPTEQELGRHLDVSRSSVREALRVLEAEGLVEVRRGLGTFVSARSAGRAAPRDMRRWLAQRGETLEQVLLVRECIEGLAAELAARHITPTGLAELDRLLAEQRAVLAAATPDDGAVVVGLAHLDLAFHLTIAAASGNDIVLEIVDHLLPAFQESNKAMLYLRRRAPEMESEHSVIRAALAEGNALAAGAAMRQHIARVRGELSQLP
jgi:GntR family transcriptional repressor for pyruvate dehydrogenase complex